MTMATTPATVTVARAHSRWRSPATIGLLLGLLGVLAFSLTLPMTRFAVAELDPWFLAFGRMALAGILSAAWLVATGAPRPKRADLALLAWSALGIVIGFPLLSSLSLRHIPANHGAIIVGLLPFATSLLAALVFKEKQPARFWICAALGSGLVIAFALHEGSGDQAAVMSFGNLAMLAAVLAGGIGYVAGARLTTRLGGVAAIMWALVFAMPLTLPVAAALAWADPPHASAAAWGAFAYVTLVSQVIGFFAWYNGLALGGIARVGQVQLLQAFFTIGFAALLFGEQVSALTWLFAIGVVATIALGRGMGVRKQ
jgi:drug/metabolite transporter (DMT)-like permease